MLKISVSQQSITKALACIKAHFRSPINAFDDVSIIVKSGKVIMLAGYEKRVVKFELPAINKAAELTDGKAIFNMFEISSAVNSINSGIIHIEVAGENAAIFGDNDLTWVTIKNYEHKSDLEEHYKNLTNMISGAKYRNESQYVRFNLKEFLQLIEKTIKVSSRDRDREILCSTSFLVSDENPKVLKAISTDSRKMLEMEIPASFKIDESKQKTLPDSLIVPILGCKKLLGKFMNLPSKDEKNYYNTKNIEFVFVENVISVSFENGLEIYQRVRDHNCRYPDAEKAFDTKDLKSVIRIDRTELLNAAIKCKNVHHNDSYFYRVDFQAHLDGTATITSKSLNTILTTKIKAIKMGGLDEFKVSFSSAFMAALLETFDCETIYLYFYGEHCAVILTPAPLEATQTEFRGLVMPLRG